MAYTYLALNMLTWAPLEELPLVGVSFGDVLNGAGEFNGELLLDANLATPAQQAAGLVVDPEHVGNLLTATVPGKTVVLVLRDGVPLNGYVVWTRTWKHDTGRLALAGQHIWSFWRRKHLQMEYAPVNYEQASIAYYLVYYLTGGLDITLSTPATGVLRTRTYEYAKQAGEAVEQLAAVIDGFDFSMPFVIGATRRYVPKFKTHYPRRGATFDATGWVFELGTNLVDYEIDEDSTRQGVQVLGVGQGEGATQLRSVATNDEAATEGWPTLDLVEARSDVQEQITLDLIAETKAETYGFPVETWRATVRAGVEPVIGSWETGDTARFVIRDARFPEGFDGYMRIVGWDCQPGEGNQEETVALTLTHDVGL